jgi:hypothetical protein
MSSSESSTSVFAFPIKFIAPIFSIVYGVAYWCGD